MPKDVIIIGAGLAGLSCALELTTKGNQVELFEAEHVVGGRTASWNESGMEVESGFHRFIGYYRELPRILKKAGVDVDHIVKWEEQIDVIMKTEKLNQHEHVMGTFGISPVQGPIKMIKGLLGNNMLIPLKDKLSLLPFFLKGFYDYVKNPKKLDQYSVYDYATKFGVNERAIEFMLVPLSTGLYFLPAHQYSAYVFFGMFAPAIPRFYTMRIGAFLGGMTEVMAQPLQVSIELRGGKVHTSTKVEKLIVENDVVKGVVIDNKEIRAQHVVLATSLGAAQKIIKRSYQQIPSEFKDMMSLPSMSAVTIQIETTKPLLPYDRTTFGPLTSLASFAEESRTTFRKSSGRLSIILTPPERFLALKDEEILDIVCDDAASLGIPLKEHLKDYRIVSHPEDFHSLAPGYNWMRPPQKTNIKGLTLAGDYTQQPFFSTMEGATVSGIRAAKHVMS